MRRSIDIRLACGRPYGVDYRFERTGDVLVCRIHGGGHRVGAVAVSRWNGSRAVAECASSSGTEVRAIALHAAHVLSTAGHCSVRCIAGLEVDSLSTVETNEVVHHVYELNRRAARDLERQRLDETLGAPTCPLSRIVTRGAELSPHLDTFLALPLDRAVEIARSATDRLRRERVVLFAPLYLSSACSNECSYCGFRRSARFSRTCLSVDQAVEEARHLARSGHRTIDLVTGEVPTDRFVDRVCETIRAILAATSIRRIHLNLGALSTGQLRRLRVADATGYHLYQETYSPETYFAVHPSGPKRDMAHRLGGPHRAAEAGFESVGLGILLGLHPLREDLGRLAGHALVLMEDFPRLGIGFSLPRIQGVDSDCAYEPVAPVDDEGFIKAVLFLRLRFPAADLTITTRERPEVRDLLISLGVTKVSAGVSTAPGGYAFDRRGTAQFEIADPRSLPDIGEVVRRSGRIAVTG